MSEGNIPSEPGIYRDVPFENYLAIRAVSNSRLGQMLKSPRHYKTNASMDEKAKHLVLGSLVHCGRLEILSLAKRYAVMPNYHLDHDNKTDAGKPSTSKATRYYAERVTAFEEANSDKIVVPIDWFEEMESIVGSLVADEKAYKLLCSPCETELTLLWIDDESGLLCKARMDWRSTISPKFTDLKTTMKLSSFQNAIGEYGYHRQMAHYQAGWSALNAGEVIEAWIIAAEKEKPYCVQCAPMDEEALEEGYRERRELLNRVAECERINHWPGPESPSAWRLPAWKTGGGNPIELIVHGETLEI